jgi:hypothetical protein
MAGGSFFYLPIPGKNFLFILKKARKIFRMKNFKAYARSTTAKTDSSPLGKAQDGRPNFRIGSLDYWKPGTCMKSDFCFGTPGVNGD